MLIPLSGFGGSTRVNVRSGIRPEDPAASQDARMFTRFIDRLEPGDVVGVRSERSGRVRFWVTTVDGLNRQHGIVYTADCPDFGDHSWSGDDGLNRFCPDGRDRLVIPTDAVLAFIDAFPHGAMVQSVTPDGLAGLPVPVLAAG